MTKPSILVGLLAYLALMLSVAQARDLHCEKKATMSMEEFQKTCAGMTKEDFSGQDYPFEAELDKIEDCACFFVNHRFIWTILTTPVVRALSESPRFAMSLMEASVTDYVYQVKAYSKYVIKKEKYLKKEVKDYLSKNLADGMNDSYIVEACTALRERFGLFRGLLLEMRKITLNDDIPYIVAGQDKGLARLMVASHVCYGAYDVDMYPVSQNHLSKVPLL